MSLQGNKPTVLVGSNELREHLTLWKAQNPMGSIGFVPTMGALHDGHGALIRKSAKENHLTVVSIFVNPKQFGPQEDFLLYPRTLDADVTFSGQYGAQVVFAPTVSDLYPSSFSTHVSLGRLAEHMCGQFRAGHFDGVATVVLLLLNLVQANRAYFGLKDYQQVAIIRRMCADLAHGTTIVAVPTLRDADGLAKSSRNQYLSPSQRQRASALPQALGRCILAWQRSESLLEETLIKEKHVLTELGFHVQYLNAFDAANLTPLFPPDLKVTDTFKESLPSDSGSRESTAVLAVAALLPSSSASEQSALPSAPRQVRLIDNVVLSSEKFYKDLQNELILLTGVGS